MSQLKVTYCAVLTHMLCLQGKFLERANVRSGMRGFIKLQLKDHPCISYLGIHIFYGAIFSDAARNIP